MVKRIIKVAVIGSGLAGLTAAYLLTRPLQSEEAEFEVHLYEKGPNIGMDLSSVEISVVGDKPWRIDVPMRSFQGGYYPQLISLYRKLGISFRKRNFSYSFSTLLYSAKTMATRVRTTMIYNGSSGLAGVSMPSDFGHTCKYTILVFVCRVWAFLMATLLLLICYLRLLCYAIPIFRPDRWKTITFSTWAAETVPGNAIARTLGFDAAWKDFTHSTVLPLFSAICTAPMEDVLSHPVEEILDYIWLTFGTDHYVVRDGVQSVVLRLKTGIRHIHLSSFVTAIQADPHNNRLASLTCKQSGVTHVDGGFHHIVFATEACHALPLLSRYATSLPQTTSVHKQAIRDQLECLMCFKYCTTSVVNHTDRNLLPSNTADVRDLNLVVLKGGYYDQSHSELCVSPSFTMATHVMWPPKGSLHRGPIFQTTNPIVAPGTDHLISHTKLGRAVLTLEAKGAVKGLYRQRARRWWDDQNTNESKLGTLQGGGRLEDDRYPGIWICGSYAYPGIPLLEGCVVSSRHVVEDGIFRCEGVEVAGRPW